jgi:predicted metal-binding membrane protein
MMLEASWVPMMAAMMLPAAVPAIVRRVREGDGVPAVPVFAGPYVVIWLLFGLAVYALYRDPAPVVAGVLIVAGVLYELTPVKRDCRRRCREGVRSGLRFGVLCLGCDVGLMLILVAVGPMSVGWMAAVAAVALLQKLPPRESTATEETTT